MKKFLIALGIMAGLYLALTVVLNMGGFCPKYIDLMPRAVGPNDQNSKGPYDPMLWHKFFCPFVEKVY